MTVKVEPTPGALSTATLPPMASARRRTIDLLKQVADGLGVLPLDLVTFPKTDLRQRLVDLTRALSRVKLSELIRFVMKHHKANPANAK